MKTNMIVRRSAQSSILEGYHKGDKVAVLKTSERGAKLITDGEKIAWVVGNWVRADGTLTPSGERKLMGSNDTLFDYNKKQAETDRWNNLTDEERNRELEQKRQDRIAALNANRTAATDKSWEMPSRDLIDASEKAYKIRTTDTQRMYGRNVSVYVYLPKSLTKITDLGNGMISVSLPAWCYKDKAYYIEKMYGKNIPAAQTVNTPVVPVTNVPAPQHRFEIYPQYDDYDNYPGNIPDDAFRPAYCYVHGNLEDDFCTYQQIGDMMCMEPSAEEKLGSDFFVRPGVYKCSFNGRNCTLYVWREFGREATTGICCYDEDEDAKDYVERISGGKITRAMMESYGSRHKRYVRLCEDAEPSCEQKAAAEIAFIENEIEPLCDDDCGYVQTEETNSVYARFSNESAHYGYNRREHAYLCKRFDLDFDNAILVKYTIRQFDYADGPSGDVSDEITAKLSERGYDMLETTSNDEQGTYLTYWYLLELCPARELDSYDSEEDEYEVEYDAYDY